MWSNGNQGKVAAVIVGIFFAASLVQAKPVKNYDIHCKSRHVGNEEDIKKCMDKGSECAANDQRAGNTCGKDLDAARDKVQEFIAESTSTMDHGSWNSNWKETQAARCQEAMKNVRETSDKCRNVAKNLQKCMGEGYTSSSESGKNRPLGTLGQDYITKADGSEAALDFACPATDSTSQMITSPTGTTE